MADTSGKKPQKDDGFFMEIGNTKPYFKAAFEGFAGAGKTYTSAIFCAGLHRYIGSTKPIVIFDTERSAKFLKPYFDEQKIRVLVKQSRSLADLKETMARCRDGLADILLIDSISHVWENFIEAHKTKKNRTFLQFEDWGVIKPAWRKEFSDPFVTGPYHCVFTGRAAYEYDEYRDENNKRQIEKSGIKMKAEGETAYEPDVLVLMSRREDITGEEKNIWREATIIKDRSTLLDGKTIPNPGFEEFKPIVDFILKDPIAAELKEQDAGVLIKTEEDKRAYLKARDILLEKIEAEMVRVWPTQTAESKRAKVDALQTCFGTASWKEVEGKPVAFLERGYAALLDHITDVTGEEPPARKVLRAGKNGEAQHAAPNIDEGEPLPY